MGKVNCNCLKKIAVMAAAMTSLASSSMAEDAFTLVGLLKDDEALTTLTM